MYFAGIDIGSTVIKSVLLNEKGEILTKDLRRTAPNSRENALQSLYTLLNTAWIEESALKSIIATGYGRTYFPEATREVSEITCHARGVFSLYHRECTIIDIGGQDSKVIRINGKGKVINFAMNDKCAAGTGRFLEVMANVLNLDVADLYQESLQVSREINISNTCTVFAESEVVGLIARGESRANIIDALHRAITTRIYAMVRRVGVADELVFTGGVARNLAIKTHLERLTGKSILIPDEPQFTGALGAALLGLNC